MLASGSGVSPPSTSNLGLSERVALALQPYFNKHDFPGASVTLVLDGQVALAQGYGLADVSNSTTVSPDSLFEVGSVTKTFTAMAILDLYQERLGTSDAFSLDDPIGKYLSFTGTPPSPLPVDFKLPQGWESLTIRQFLDMSTGVQDIGTQAGWWQQITTTGNEPFAFTPPGSEVLYSNANFYTLGALIEVLTGDLYGDFINTTLFHPLGMTESGVMVGTTTMVPNQADGYLPYSSSAGWTQADYLPGQASFSSGAIVSSAVDMGKYITAMLDGKILDPASYYSLWASTPIPRYPFVATNPQYALRGMGWDVDNWTSNGPLEVRKDGGMPGYSTELILYPTANGSSGNPPYAHGDGVFVSINSSTDSSSTPDDVTAFDVANTVYEAAKTGAIVGTVASDAGGSTSSGGSTPLAGWTAYLDLPGVGHYVPGDPTRVTDAQGQFVFNNVTPGGYQIGLVPQAGWRPVQPDTWTVSLRASAGTVSDQNFTLSRSTEVLGSPLIGGPRNRITITFDNDLSASLASNVKSFRIGLPGPDRKFGTRDDIRIRARHASYDPATHTVTLTLARRLPRQVPARLRIAGNALKSVLGVPVSANGTPGANYVIVLAPASHGGARRSPRS